MVQEKKVILMTKLQAYEDKYGKKDAAVANYFRGDYLGMQVLKSIIYITIAAVIFYAGYIFYHLEEFLKEIYQMDLLEYGKTLLTDYLILAAAYAVITYLVYALRYTKARKHLKHYYGGLKKLAAMFQKEEV